MRYVVTFDKGQEVIAWDILEMDKDRLIDRSWVLSSQNDLSMAAR